MQIMFSEEQGMLLETAKAFTRRHSTIEIVRDRLNAESFGKADWQEMVDLGWLAINVPEKHGGLGMGLDGVVPIVECMGQSLMSSPYAATVLFAEAISHNGSEAQQAALLPEVAAGAIAALALTEPDGAWDLSQIAATGVREQQGFRLHGRKCFVSDADVAAYLLVSVNIDGKPRMAFLESRHLPAGAITRETVIDETRRSFEINLDGIELLRGAITTAGGFRPAHPGSIAAACR